MAKYRYTSNCWGYYHVRESITAESIAKRVCGLGFDGFDLFAGLESTPDLSLDESDARFEGIRKSAEDGGGCISSLMLVGFDSTERSKAAYQLRRAAHVAPILGTATIHLLPRKVGVTQEQGLQALADAWSKAGSAIVEAGLVCTVENHVWFPNADEDIFLVRSEADFNRVLDMTQGEIKVKFDPSWLLALDSSLDPIAVFERLLPDVAVLDLKDWRDAKFVEPGTGLVDFKSLAEVVSGTKIDTLSVEVEHHHKWAPPPTDMETIDRVHIADLDYYRGIFAERCGDDTIGG